MESTLPVVKPKHKRHSIFGAISLIVGMVSMLLGCGGLGVIIVLGAIHQGQVDMSGFDTTIGALCAVASGPLALIGLGSGFAGFFEPDRDRMPNILGIILAALSLAILAVLLLLGIIGSGRPTFQPNL
jgi:hypothetical protein